MFPGNDFNSATHQQAEWWGAPDSADGKAKPDEQPWVRHLRSQVLSVICEISDTCFVVLGGYNDIIILQLTQCLACNFIIFVIIIIACNNSHHYNCYSLGFILQDILLESMIFWPLLPYFTCLIFSSLMREKKWVWESKSLFLITQVTLVRFITLWHLFPELS